MDKKEANKKALELMAKFRDENYFSETECKENSKYNSLIVVKEMLEEHSCMTLNDERWAFWAQVETELNNL